MVLQNSSGSTRCSVPVASHYGPLRCDLHSLVLIRQEEATKYDFCPQLISLLSVLLLGLQTVGSQTPAAAPSVFVKSNVFGHGYFTPSEIQRHCLQPRQSAPKKSAG